MANEIGSDYTVPSGIARLFGDESPAVLLGGEHRDPVIARLLTDGDRRDLRWLFARVGDTAIREGVERWGQRRLDERNRWFWSWLLDARIETDSPERGSAPWPLA